MQTRESTKNIKYTLAALGLLIFICYIAFKRYLTLKYAYYFYDICGDSYYNSYPSLYGYADYIAQHHIPAWSFKVGMGQNIFPFMLRDPFDIILYLCGSKNIVYLTIYVEVIKIILSGLVFFRYLRILDFSFYTSLIGCILFAFCGFTMEGSAWFGFSFEAFNLALLLLSFELLFTRQKWLLFSITICLYCITMPFNLYLYGLFMIFYVIFRYLHLGNSYFKKLKSLSLRIFIAALLGILLAGPFLLQNILSLLNSPRGSESSLFHNQYSEIPVFSISDKLQLGTAILRFFSNDILGSGSNFKGWDTILGAPLFYIGLICLLIIPQLFVFYSRKSRFLLGAFITFFLLPTIFPYFRHAIWLFTGDYYRAYGFFVAIFILLYALYALEYIFRKHKINYTVLITTLVILLLILFFHPFIDEKIIDQGIRTFVICMLIVYTVILGLIPIIKNINVTRAVFFIAVFFEICYSGYVTANRRDAFLISWLKEAKAVYNNYTYDGVKFIQKNDASFYRIDKSFNPPTARYTDLNFSEVQGYNATTCYNSFNQLYYIRYLQLMGVIDKNNEAESRWAIGLIDNPVLESENSVKYFLNTKNHSLVWPQMWDSIAAFDEIKVYRNNCVLPFGYGYDHYITESNFNVASPDQKKSITLDALVIKDNDTNKLNGLQQFQLKDTLQSALNYDTFSNEINNLRKDTLSVITFDDAKLYGTINLSENKLLYLSIPYDNGWQLTVDGKKEEKIIVDGGMTGVFLMKGFHTIEMRYSIQFMKIGLAMTILSIIIIILMSIPFKKEKVKS